MKVQFIGFVLAICALLSASGQDCLTPPAGLVGWWTGDNDARDKAGFPNDGTAQNVTHEDGKVGGAFRFAGGSPGTGTSGGGGGYATAAAASMVRIPAMPELNIRSLTFAAWINPSTEEYRPILMYQKDGDYMGALFWTGYLPGLTGRNTLYANLRQGPGLDAVIEMPGVIFTNRWTFVAVTYEQPTGLARLIVNDQVVKEQSLAVVAPNTDDPVYIGHAPSTTLDMLGARSFEGGIDEVQIFNRALAIGELKAIYEAGAAGLCKPVISETTVALQQPTATFSQTMGDDFSVGRMIDGETGDNLGWSIAPGFAPETIVAQTAAFETVSDVGFAGGTVLKFQLLFNVKSVAGTTGHTLGRFRLSATTDPRVAFADGLPSGGDVEANWFALPVTTAAAEKATLTVLPDNSVLASGELQEADLYTISTATRMTGITGIRIETLEDPSLPYHGPGREPLNGNFCITEMFVSARPGGGPVVTNQPVSTNVVAGGSATFRVAVTSSLPVTYQWMRNGAPLQNETNSILTIENADFTAAGTYSARIENAEGTSLSAGAVLNVFPADASGVATLWISNRAPANAPVLGLLGSPLAGARYLAQAYVGSSVETLAPAGAAVPFLSGDDAGYFHSIALVLTNVAPGARVTVQVRAWDSDAGSTFEQAVEAGGDHGVSLALLSSTGDGSSPPPQLAGLQGFALAARPSIVSQPSDQTLYVGQEARFDAVARGSTPLSFRWFLDGSILAGATSSNLALANVQLEQSGEYLLVVTNALGSATSRVARLTVKIPDTTPPIITLTTPAPGETFDEVVTLSGSVTDNERIASAIWKRNGAVGGNLKLDESGRFAITNIPLVRGVNLFELIAVDASTNAATKTVAVTNLPSRAVFVGEVLPHQEGERVNVPIMLSSRGEVAGLNFSLNYDRTFLAEPEIDWSELLQGALTQINTNTAGSVRASFALSGTTLPAGTTQLATVRFRSRSVPNSMTTPLMMSVTGLFGANGNALPASGTEVRGGALRLTQRRFTGDNNANDRLDISDAATIMRFANLAEQPRFWDVRANDLNANSALDAGDVIRVLRAVVGLDPQPTLSALRVSALSQTGQGPRLRLQIDNQHATPGQQVRVTVHLEGFDRALSGAAFTLQYPAAALKLTNASAHRVGAMAPAGVPALWNLSPSQNYEAQDGAISLAVTSDRNWSTNQGPLAEFLFTVQPGVTNRDAWTLNVANAELSSGYDLVAAQRSAGTFYRMPISAPEFQGTPALKDGHFTISLRGGIGIQHRIEVSEDLVGWTALETLSPSSASTEFVDTAAGQHRRRFYRAIAVE